MQRGELRKQPAPKAATLADWALSRGVVSLTTAQIAEILGIPDGQVCTRLHAPKRRGHWTTPATGLWLPVPPEYRTWGAPEGIEIVDTLMRHLHTRYYVGWLSAAAIHGAAHQAPQRFQAAVERPIRNRVVGRTSFEFLTRTRVTLMPTVEKPTRSGTARVSSIEATALDIADAPAIAGGLSNAATVLVELADGPAFTIDRVVDLAEHYPVAALRRLGWMLATFTGRQDLEKLRARAMTVASPSKLQPALPSTGPIDKAWSLILNDDVEPDT